MRDTAMVTIEHGDRLNTVFDTDSVLFVTN